VNLDPLPGAVWVASDVNLDISIKPGSVPKTYEELVDFSEAINHHFVLHGAAWARYLLFDEKAKPIVELKYEFIKNNS